MEKIPRITTVITAYHPHHRNRRARGVMLHPDRRRLSGINHFCDEERDVTRVVTVEKSSPPALSVEEGAVTPVKKGRARSPAR